MIFVEGVHSGLFLHCYTGSVTDMVMVVYKGCSILPFSNGQLQRCKRLTRLRTRPFINTIALQVVAIFIAEFHTTKGQHHTADGS